MNPPDSVRAHTWYHWIDGNISKNGITKDLEALKEVGISGFQLFNISWATPFGGVEFNSESFHEHVSFAIKEAERLGLEAGINSASGWSATGGPWVEPQHSMKTLIWSEININGDGKQKIILPKPELSDEQKPYDFYRDIAVIAFPTPANRDYRVTNWEAKSFNEFMARSNKFVPNFQDAPEDAVIRLNDILVLSDRLHKNGLLKWNPPQGKWTILRIGYTTTAAYVRPASQGGRGLEIDKLSREAAEMHWDQLLSRVLEDADGKKAFTTILIDSYEVGNQNWTEGFDKFFEERCGYDLIPRLICMTGRVLEGSDYTEQVLWDVRTTVNELMIENYFKFFREKCHKEGLKLACEPYGTGSFDAPAVAKLVDVPMTEFWHKDDPWKRRHLWEWTAQIVPSAAHLSDNPIVGAEAFTRMQGDWTVHPYRMKVWGDRAFTNGVNRYYFHTSAHQPWHESVKPGMTMGQFGTNFHRNNTWFAYAKPWLDYIARCQFIFQNGTYITDILAVYGDERGINNLPGQRPENEVLDMQFLDGLRFDLTNLETVNNLSVNDKGEICVSHKGRILDNTYKILVIKRGLVMRPEFAEKLGKLAEQGALIIAPKPLRVPGLKGYPESEQSLQELIDRYWVTGMILPPEEFEKRLESLEKDCDMPGDMEYCHHRLDDGDYYFLSNQSYHYRKVKCVFRIEGMKPELWDPESGEIEKTLNWKRLEDGRTEVEIDFTPAGSVFVVFRKKTLKKGNYSTTPNFQEVENLDGSWDVSFGLGNEKEENVVFDSLIYWNHHNNEEIKYFSGTACYTKNFNFSRQRSNLFLDLGNVDIIARVTLNDKDLGICWKPPYRVDISEAIQEGRNHLQVDVVNLWPNRLIGDDKYPEFGVRSGTEENPGKNFVRFPEWLTSGNPMPYSSRTTFVTWKHWNEDSLLLNSGLTGPVKIISKSALNPN